MLSEIKFVRINLYCFEHEQNTDGEKGGTIMIAV